MGDPYGVPLDHALEDLSGGAPVAEVGAALQASEVFEQRPLGFLRERVLVLRALGPGDLQQLVRRVVGEADCA